MGSAHSKVNCLFLPAQSGKTRKVEEQITEYKRLCGITNTHSIDIFISANNRLLVYQTSARLRRDLGAATTATVEEEDPTESDATSEITDPADEESDAIIKGRIFSWTHGRKTGIEPKLLAYEINEREIEMVLMCANKRRFTYLHQMLQNLTSLRSFLRDPFNIYIWIDEADSSMSIWRQFESALTTIPAITQVTLVSATFGSILKKYDRLRVIPFAQTHPDCYRRLADCNTQVVPATTTKKPEDYVAHILTTYPALQAPGLRAFIPGQSNKESHTAIANLLSTRYNFAVILINGTCKELRIPGQATIDLRDYLSCPDPDQLPPEFNQTLAEMYVTHHLERFPLAITGYLCIQRGVTFQCAPSPTATHNGFVFDYGIIPSIRNAAEAYQTMARIFGNTGDFSNYVKPTIYTDEDTFARVHNQEEIAVNLPRIIHAEELEDVGQEDFDRAAGIATTHSPADPRKTVPIIVSVTPAFLSDFRATSRKAKKHQLLLSALTELIPDAATFLADYVPIQFTCPTSAGSIKRHITDVVNSALNNRPYKIDITAAYMNQNCYNCYIDEAESRLCLVVWKGATAITGGGSAAAAAST